MNMSQHKIRKALGLLPEVQKVEDSPSQDTNTIIIEEYLKQFDPPPQEAFGQGVMIRTTADIINDLADMADLDPDEVNAVLIRRGYRPGRNNSGSFGWLMRQRGPRAE